MNGDGYSYSYTGSDALDVRGRQNLCEVGVYIVLLHSC